MFKLSHEIIENLTRLLTSHNEQCVIASDAATYISNIYAEISCCRGCDGTCSGSCDGGCSGSCGGYR